LSSFVAYNEHHVLEDDEEGVIGVKIYIFVREEKTKGFK
jgi:hypothetical protein